jgi:four helix bundle protein
MAKSFETLEAWKRSIELSDEIYKITGKFPKEELFGITSQIRRASVSITNNIAEGTEQDSIPQSLKYLRISIGSLNEVDNLTIISYRLGYINDDELKDLKKSIEMAGKVIRGYKKYLQSKKQ